MNEKVFSPLSILSLACLSHRTSFCLYWYWCNFNVTRSCLLTPRLHRPSLASINISSCTKNMYILPKENLWTLSECLVCLSCSPHTKTDVFMPKKIYSRLVSAAIGVRFLGVKFEFSTAIVNFPQELQRKCHKWWWSERWNPFHSSSIDIECCEEWWRTRCCGQVNCWFELYSYFSLFSHYRISLQLARWFNKL